MRSVTGNWLIYQIQFRDSPNTDEWFVMDEMAINKVEKPLVLGDSFMASGDCWQRLGIHGTFSEAYARQALRTVRRHDTTGKQYRLIRRSIKQKVEALTEERWDNAEREEDRPEFIRGIRREDDAGTSGSSDGG